MGAPTNIYVDPAINANSGTGTIGDPYGDLQYALNTMTFDSTNGNRINIIPGVAEVLTGSLSIPFTPSLNSAHCVIGSSTPGVLAEIDGNAGNFTIWGGGKSLVSFEDIKMGNVGTATVITAGPYSVLRNCEIHNGNAGASSAGAAGQSITGCYLHDISGVGISFGSGMVSHCYLKNGASRKFTSAIVPASFTAVAYNIISVDGTSNGIQSATYYNRIFNNTIISLAGTGYGIAMASDTVSFGATIFNNLIEGFSGTGGRGISGGTSTTHSTMVSENSVFNCASAWAGWERNLIGQATETLAETPFAKAGADTFANRFLYFAPKAVGNVLNGFPVGSNVARGAVQPASGGGRLVGRSLLIGNRR